MPFLREVLELNRDINSVWDFVCNFENISKWDPGVRASSKRGDEPTKVGTQYDLTTVFKNNESKMLYQVKEWNPTSKLRIDGFSDNVNTIDTIYLEDIGEGRTKLTYEAQINLNGWRVLFTPFVSGSIQQLGKDAMHGLLKNIDGKLVTPPQ